MEWVPGDLSVIGVGNIPLSWTNQKLIKVLTPKIHGGEEKIKNKFSLIEFRKKKIVTTSYKKGKAKQLIRYLSRTALIRLPGSLNPAEIMKKIEGTQAKGGVLHTYTPDPGEIPEREKKKKAQLLSRQLEGGHNLDPEARPEVVFMCTQEEIQRELQTKYLGLYKLSLTVDHRLLADISEIIYERLAVVIKQLDGPMFCYGLSKRYRRAHPHHTDFSLIVSTLHRIEDEMRQPRSFVAETQLLAVQKVPIGSHHNIPLADLKVVVKKYIKRISGKVKDHIMRLSTKLPPEHENQIATIKVRQELKNQLPYIAEITHDVMHRDIMPNITASLHVRIYGEPYMPPREHYDELLKTVGARAVMRYKRIYNCIWLTVSPENYTKFMELDGTILLGHAKLICRPSQVPLYKLSASIKDRIRAMFGVTPLDTANPALPETEDVHEQGADDNMEYGTDDDVEHGMDDDVEHGTDDDMEYGMDDDVEHGMDDYVEHGTDDDMGDVIELE